MREDDRVRKVEKGPENTRSANWSSCPLHNRQYRQGDSCPDCDREARTNLVEEDE
jgi:hypothetical protein